MHCFHGVGNFVSAIYEEVTQRKLGHLELELIPIVFISDNCWPGLPQCQGRCSTLGRQKRKLYILMIGIFIGTWHILNQIYLKESND